jgi:hypothetical protein
MPGLTIGPDRGGVCAVWDLQGRQVGNLKLVDQRRKFKALGHDDEG